MNDESIVVNVGDTISVNGYKFICTELKRELSEPAKVTFKQPIELMEVHHVDTRRVLERIAGIPDPGPHESIATTIHRSYIEAAQRALGML
jgi:hypothetical protein